MTDALGLGFRGVGFRGFRGFGVSFQTSIQISRALPEGLWRLVKAAAQNPARRYSLKGGVI